MYHRVRLFPQLGPSLLDNGPHSSSSMSSQTVPEGCELVLLSPLEIHFSQTRIRAEFQDGHTLEETLAEIKVATKEASGDGAQIVDDAEGYEKKEGKVDRVGDVADAIVLEVPFPPIEVTKWRCKLREPDGSPKLDPSTGLELYSREERWFTFDNRRLCCLQKAAVTHWPRQVVCEVIEVPQPLARNRELRKFDTKTFGCSLTVGRRDDPTPESWCWRSAVGMPAEEQPEDGVARQRSARWRGRGRGGDGPPSGAGRGRHNRAEEGEGGNLELIRSALLFLLVYLGLRLVVTVFFHGTQGKSPSSSAGDVTT